MEKDKYVGGFVAKSVKKISYATMRIYDYRHDLTFLKRFISPIADIKIAKVHYAQGLKLIIWWRPS